MESATNDTAGKGEFLRKDRLSAINSTLPVLVFSKSNGCELRHSNLLQTGLLVISLSTVVGGSSKELARATFLLLRLLRLREK